MLSATLRIVTADAETVASAIEPEAGRELPRTRVSVTGRAGETLVEITASDTSAMRAALNSYLECIRITEDIERITK
ncbi:MAG: hypothetical protein KA502_00115 [Candidatus Methanomethylophilaceae archaeon]|nr:hypothetical protein [Candidatus Methanomethylophilaceae archaeon]